MSLDLIHIILSLSVIILLGSCLSLILYFRKVIAPVIYASQESAELFTRLDSYRQHVQSVYEMPTFYGDQTLQSLLEHTDNIAMFLSRYENIYSFTQPDLIEILEEVDEEYREKEEEKEK
jgi:hypothetical protein